MLSIVGVKPLAKAIGYFNVEHNNFTEDFLVCSRQELITEVKPFDECTVDTALEEEEYEI